MNLAIVDDFTSFLHRQPMLATASLSGVLGVWDLSSYRLRQQCKHPVSIKYCEYM